MDQPTHLRLKDTVSELRKFTDPRYYAPWRKNLNTLQEEVHKERDWIEGIRSILQAGANQKLQLAIAEKNHSLIQQAEEALELGAQCLEAISSEGLFIRNETHEAAIKAENDFRVAENIKARKARSIVVTLGEVTPLRPLLPRRRERESLSGGDLSHKSGDRIFEPYRPPGRNPEK